MSWWLILSGSITMLLALLLLGMPVFAAFLILNVVGVLVLFGPAGFGMFANSIFTTGTFGSLSAVPLFILMGEILFRSGAMDVLFDSLDRLIGRFRGRQYVLCIILSAILGALSGAAMAVAGMLGRSLLPTMRRRGYDLRMSVGTMLGGASLDPIIPPSVLAIIVATLAEVSIGKMLIAGVIPGLLLTGMFLVYVLVRLHFNPALAPDVAADLTDRATRGSAIVAVVRMLPISLIFFLVMGLMMLGVATPTEAAATGVFGALMLSWLYGGLSRRMLIEALSSTATIAPLLLVVMSCAVMFSQLLTFTGAAATLAEMVVALDLSGPVMLFMMMAIPFILFMFLDQVALMMILIPIYQPVLKVFGFDEIWFWMLFLIVAVQGGLTPPFGYTLFALKSAAPDVPIIDIFRAAWPYVWMLLFGMIIMALFPDIITFLPNLIVVK